MTGGKDSPDSAMRRQPSTWTQLTTEELRVIWHALEVVCTGQWRGAQQYERDHHSIVERDLLEEIATELRKRTGRDPGAE